MLDVDRPPFSKRLSRGLAVVSLLLAGAGAVWLLKLPEEPIRLGFVGGLTGRVADLGVAGRDGALLAVEEQSASGGVQGRLVELVVGDDAQDASLAASALHRVLDAKAVAVVGNMTSSMSVVSAPIANERHVLLMSPTTSTNSLTGKDDWFFRVYPASSAAGESLAEELVNKRSLRAFCVAYDVSNRAYTEDLLRVFSAEVVERGGNVLGTVPFESAQGPRFTDLARSMMGEAADCYLILANSMDTAMLCQQLRKLGDRRPVAAGEWSASEELIQYGGQAVEGLILKHTFDRDSQAPAYLRFREAFVARFGYAPGFAAAHSYDATRILLEALSKNADPSRLRETILGIGTFEGLQRSITFDSFGDVRRLQFSATVSEGRFVSLEPH